MKLQQEEEIVTVRLEQWRTNMEATPHAIKQRTKPVASDSDSLEGVRRWVWLIALPIAACSASAPLPAVTEVGSAGADPPSTIAPIDESAPPTVDDMAEARFSMVEFQIAARDIADEEVLEAMRQVPRHLFVPDDVVDLAYSDSALPIGYGQTISQPYIVGLMSQALEVAPGDKVLEIGTGSGYQAAVLAAMGCEVFTMEIIPELAERATNTLAMLGYDATVSNADGYFGWEEHAPFDGIIVTAAPDHVPQPLIDQLAPGAALVIPVGPIGAVQTMWRFQLDGAGEVIGENLGSVLFVPFTRAGE
jgi:protein-L-isoaspartate(D-aspartate) O-methyltransferase